MDGIHDLGGMHGFGAVPIEDDEPVFHERWEARTFGISASLSLRQLWNIDAGRHGVERLAPAFYLQASYYERWRERCLLLLVERGLVTPEEFEARLRDPSSPAAAVAVPPPAEPAVSGYVRELARAPRFALGQRVRARNLHPSGHTRLPRYVRGRAGVVTAHYGAQVYPDHNAHGGGEDPQHLYNVGFEGAELWGPDAEPASSVRIDLYEPYLEAAEEA